MDGERAWFVVSFVVIVVVVVVVARSLAKRNPFSSSPVHSAPQVLLREVAAPVGIRVALVEARAVGVRDLGVRGFLTRHERA